MYAELRHTKWTRELVWDKCVAAPVSYLPAVVLGLLLNLLDAVSYGKLPGNTTLPRIVLVLPLPVITYFSVIGMF